jgi:alkanesulfonate monooxygenase SsuD/methylene tetrahydromethanopterin reductase-like flavin-dependent oxidoreductase (luciferase family)
MRFGAQLWSQHTSWAEFRDSAIAAERAGWDSVWTWDHLLAIFGPWEQPIFEGWMALAAVGAVTTKVRLGLMVGANTFRNPGLTAKLATTLDQVTAGRAVLGIGGAWFEREHEAFGFDDTWGSGFGERLDRLDESVMLVRRLLDDDRIGEHHGRFYTMRDALVAPIPVQRRLPILIGGSGPRKTLRTTARYADGWNTTGTLDEVKGHLATLDERCAEIGRDRSEIELTISFPVTIRDTVEAARGDADARYAVNGIADMGPGPDLQGPPALVAEAIAPYRDLGFSTVIVRLPAPFDRETIERMAEVAAILDG